MARFPYPCGGSHRTTTPILFVLTVLLITITGWIDHITGTQISVIPLYAVLVAAGAWYLGPRKGAALAIWGAVMGLVGEVTIPNGPSLSIKLWNAGARCLILLFVVLVVARMRDALLSRDRAVEQAHAVAERLKAADELKNTFLNAVAHELRNPVTVILGSLGTLERLDASLGDDDRRALRAAAFRSAGKLDRMVRDLLDVDRIARDVTALDRTDVDLARLAEGVLSGMDLGSESRVQLLSDPIRAHVDVPKVERILENLIANAIKYCPPSAAIRVMVTTHQGVPALVVEDSGPGVDPAAREVIFEPFRRGDPGDGLPGVGIGLSLVRAFAKLHGGDACVEGRPGGGARFVVTLPSEKTEMPSERVDEASSSALSLASRS